MISKIRLQLTADHSHLPVCVRLDDQIIYQARPGPDPTDVMGWFDDDVADVHRLTIELQDKTEQDTVLDQQGNIIKDHQIFVDSICIDDIDISQVFYDLSTYTHDGNGHEELHARHFYRVMGCNGVVIFEFTSPVYAWLLEHA